MRKSDANTCAPSIFQWKDNTVTLEGPTCPSPIPVSPHSEVSTAFWVYYLLLFFKVLPCMFYIPKRISFALHGFKHYINSHFEYIFLLTCFSSQRYILSENCQFYNLKL